MSRRSKPPGPRHRDQGVDLFDQYPTNTVLGSVASGSGRKSKRWVRDLLRDPRTPRPVRLLVAVFIGLAVLTWIVLVVSQFV